jgi:hypothetical protein
VDAVINSSAAAMQSEVPTRQGTPNALPSAKRWLLYRVGVRTYSSQLDVNALYSACQASAHALPWVGTRKQRIDARPGLRENVSCDNIAPSTAPIIMAASTWQLSWQPVRRPHLGSGLCDSIEELGMGRVLQLQARRAARGRAAPATAFSMVVGGLTRPYVCVQYPCIQ